MRVSSLLLGLLLCVAVVSAAGAAPGPGPSTNPIPSAPDILRTLLSAPARVDYEGTKVISTLRGARAETVTILEAYKRLGRLRLEFLSPEAVSGRLMIDDGVSIWQYEPSLNLVIRGPSFVQGGAHPERAAEILRRFAVNVLGREEVIGRATVVLALSPGAGGSDRRLWVDEATGVVLRTEERDERGEIAYVSFFSRISYSLNLPAAMFVFHRPAGARVLALDISGDPAVSPQELRRQIGAAIVAPQELLRRYTFRDGRVARRGAFGAAVLTYTDGVSVLTVFQTPTSRMAFPEVGEEVSLSTGRGRLLDLGYSRVLLWQFRGMNFAVLGNVPRTILLAVATELAAAQR